MRAAFASSCLLAACSAAEQPAAFVGNVADPTVAAAPLAPVSRRAGDQPCARLTVTPAPVGAVHLTDVSVLNVDVALECRGSVVSVELASPRGSPHEVRSLSAALGRASFSFPIAGTTIAQRGLWGRWSIRALLDGRPAATASLELER